MASVTPGSRVTASRSTRSTRGWGTCWPASANSSHRGGSGPKQSWKREISRPRREVTNTASCDHTTGSGTASRNWFAMPTSRCSIVRTLVVFARGRSSETSTPRLEHDDLDAPLPELEGGGEPGRTATGDEDRNDVGKCDHDRQPARIARRRLRRPFEGRPPSSAALPSAGRRRRRARRRGHPRTSGARRSRRGRSPRAPRDTDGERVAVAHALSRYGDEPVDVGLTATDQNRPVAVHRDPPRRR